MKVVNLFGGPGSGKSTLAAGLFYHMKLLGFNVELVTEYAKQLLFEGRLENMLDRQEYIYAKQHAKLQDLENKADWVITDSPILLSAVYPEINRALNNDLTAWPALPIFKELVRTQFSYYDNVNFWLIRPETYQTEGRLQDESQAQWIDHIIWTEIVLSKHSMKNIKVGEESLNEMMTWLGVIDK